MSILFEGQGTTIRRRTNRDVKGRILYHARRLKWQEQRFSLHRLHHGLSLQLPCPHCPISLARPCRSGASSPVCLHHHHLLLFLLYFIPPTPLLVLAQSSQTYWPPFHPPYLLRFPAAIPPPSSTSPSLSTYLTVP